MSLRYDPPVDPTRCLGRVFGEGAWRAHQCLRKPSTAAGYCKQHDPQILEGKHREKLAQWDAERAASKKREDDVRAKKARLLAIVNDEAREILRELGVAP